MIILGIDTATSQAGCALGSYEGVLALSQCAKGRRHAENLTPAIRFICEQAQIELGEIGAIAVDLGPGLFTGLRVGIATGKAMAHALRVPVIGVASLDLVAFAVRYSSRLIVSAIDARRSELYYAFYWQVPGGVQRLGDYQLGSPADLAADLAERRDEMLLVGDGFQRYHDLFAGVDKAEMADAGFAHPSAASLVQLAHAKALREEFEPPASLEPIYLRKPDAEINWVTRNDG